MISDLNKISEKSETIWEIVYIYIIFSYEYIN